MSCCVYLPWRIGFMFKRPVTTNDAFANGGMRFEVVEPFARLRLVWGSLCLLATPKDMMNPGRAFKETRSRKRASRSSSRGSPCSAVNR